MKVSHNRVFHSYLISYISVVLIAVAGISVLFSYRFIRKIKDEADQVMHNKIYSMLVDFNNQLEIIEGMAFDMVIAEEFRPEYFKLSKYYEIEALNRLKRYKSASQIIDYYFLFYQDSQTIFTSDGTTMSFAAYCSDRFGKDVDPESIMNTLGSNHGMMLTDANEANRSRPVYLLSCPLQRYAFQKPAAILCCEVTPERINQRTTQMVGAVPGRMDVYLNGILITGTQAKEAVKEVEAEEAWEAVSEDGRIRILYYAGDEESFYWQDLLSGQSTLILAGIILLLLIVAVYAAYRSYIPIRLLSRKYLQADENKRHEGNELQNIDSFIDLLMQKDMENNRQMREQHGVIREQMINLILSGGYRNRFQERLLWLNLKLDGPFYGTMLVRLLSPGDPAKDKVKGLLAGIEELSDEEISLYSVYEEGAGPKDRVFYILVGMKEQYQMEEAMESVKSLFEIEGCRIELFCGDVCNSLKEIQKTRAVIKEDEIEKKAKEEERVIHKQSKTAEKIIAYIDDNCTMYDLSLDKVSGEFGVTPTYLCRLIKQQTGVSYKNYLIGLRVEAAKKMLRDQDISIADVCQKSGYSNVSHFIKIFQQITGVTPAKFRDAGEM